MEPGSWAKSPAFQPGRSSLLTSGEDVKVDWPHAHVCAPYIFVCECVCVKLVLPAWVHFRCMATALRSPLPAALGGDGGGAKGDVTAMSAPCMCLFAPENETLVSVQPPWACLALPPPLCLHLIQSGSSPDDDTHVCGRVETDTGALQNKETGMVLAAFYCESTHLLG